MHGRLPPGSAPPPVTPQWERMAPLLQTLGDVPRADAAVRVGVGERT